MRAGFWLNPSRFRRHGDGLICNSEESLDFRFFDKEDDGMGKEFCLIHDSRNVFEFFENFFIQKLAKDFVLKSEGRHFFQNISWSSFEVDSIDFFPEFQDYLKIVQLVINAKGWEILYLQLNHFNMVQLSKLLNNLHIFWNFLDHSMLWMHHHIFAWIYDCLDPKISLFCFITQ